MEWPRLTLVTYLVSVTLWIYHVTDCRLAHSSLPDEQRLYRELMSDYEPSVRPVYNHSERVIVHFRLSLNQIVDLDERKQVLTTNVFIDQQWVDDHLKWRGEDYNGIKTMRIPASLIWLPDTFIFNNADDGSTGFMSGVYVVLSSNGSVLWPVPVKLKSSCHVDITYFPFDDQKCILRFGSWIYSGEWMDFESSLESINLDYYVDNSEWQLVAIEFEKSTRRYSCCPSPHPDLTYTLHIRRRTFYYVFNIIVPCIMLSVLTLLTFWLPTTSGEKISLGLSVFLAFSMFMLLIAEEVPATSKSVPLIGVYLTTVMTMTSVSVIMSVMVINLYNRGYRAKCPPGWLKTVILVWLGSILHMEHDIVKLAKAIRLEEDEEAKYMCEAHELEGVLPKRKLSKSPEVLRSIINQSPDRKSSNDKLSSEHGVVTSCHLNEHQCSRVQNDELKPKRLNSSVLEGEQGEEEEDGPVWRRRDTLLAKDNQYSNHVINSQSEDVKWSRDRARHDRSRMTDQSPRSRRRPPLKVGSNTPKAIQPKSDWLRSDQSGASSERSGDKTAGKCNKHVALMSRRQIVVEWQTIALVIDRLLFWIFLLATIIAYIIILFIIPYSKPTSGQYGDLGNRISISRRP